MSLKNITKLVVIAGCQRSGTTLTGQIIGAHPNAFLLDEGDGLYDWFHSTDDNLLEDRGRFNDVIQKADKKYRNVHSRLKTNSIHGVSINENISHLVLKAPNLTYSFSRLARLNIPVSVIYPQRDPRSVVASMARLPGIDMVGNQCRLIKQDQVLSLEFLSELSQIEQNQVPDYIKRALIWRIKTRMFQKFVNANIPTFKFNYEALISDKQTYCLQFADHVDLEYNELMEQHESVFQGTGPGGTKRTRAIDTSSTDLWKKTLTKEQAYDILRVTGY